MDSEIAVERHYILVPYPSEPRWLACQSPQSLEQGQHHVPRVFQPSVVDANEPAHHISIPSWFIIASRNSFNPPTRPNTSITPYQIQRHWLADDSIIMSQEEQEEPIGQIQSFYGETGSKMWNFLCNAEEFPVVGSVEIFAVSLLAFYRKKPWAVVEILEESFDQLSDILKVIAFGIVEDYYLKMESPWFLRLGKVYERARKFYERVEKFDELRSKTEKISYFIPEVERLEDREGVVLQYRKKLYELHRESVGLRKEMFIN